ncbi:MAG TPA: hypothetical protein VE972_09020 [Conexibacter sp.]|nr:hypothetical protein [Conexibacter sp.]
MASSPRTAAATTRKPRTAKKSPSTTAKPKPAAAKATASKSTAAPKAKQATRSTVGRAVLVPIGAALEARDVLEQQLARFERRGETARTQVEREVRRTRARIEREARQARRGLERRGTQARRNLSSNVELVSDRVENVVQNGVNTGIKLVNGVQDRFSRAA